MQDADVNPQGSASRGAGLTVPPLLTLVTILVAVATILFVFWDGVSLMAKWWQEKEEYSHGVMIPFVALYLALLKGEEFSRGDFHGSWWGALMVLGGIALFLLGELSAIYTIIQYGFLLAIWGLVVATIGLSGLKLLWAPLAYLIFMVPLPEFVYNSLSNDLRLISSEIGVLVVRSFGISVFLEGNVIDLGEMQLQVADACSGMRYLFPLMSFGFLCGYIFDGKTWQRWFVFLSSIPLTIFMNSFRIGMIGVLVEYYGIGMARGFLHDFEGWVIFIACVGLMFLEMWVFTRMNKQSMADAFVVDLPTMKDVEAFMPKRLPSTQVKAAVGVLVLGTVVSLSLQNRAELIPEHVPLRTFPLVLEDWSGREQGMEQVYLDQLKLTDYLLARYTRPQDPLPMDLYIAYYASQSKGASLHSPKACLPSGGWEVESLTQETVEGVRADGSPLTVNRALISMGRDRQLVYYWFMQRGRLQTNEYLVKWFIFWDALTQNRTDGSLVRVTTYIPEGSDLAEADARLREFIGILDPSLDYHLPQKDAVFASGDDMFETRAAND